MKKQSALRVFPIVLFMGFSSLVAAEPDKALSQDSRPRVLIIGDSISIGYAPFVTEMLKGEATIQHNKGNAQDTGTGLKLLDQWLGTKPWKVIHFNWGLWDLCYRHPDSKVQGNRDKVKGTITTGPEQYEKNLEELVGRLKRTGATLIWAATTVVPEDEAGRIVGDDTKYNDIAARVMRRHSIRIDDLHTLTRGFAPGLFAGPGNVHYTKDGYQKIAAQVADRIRAALNGGPGRREDRPPGGGINRKAGARTAVPGKP